MKKIIFCSIIFLSVNIFAQKDSLQIGDYYADDQIYALVSYNQMYQQPNAINRSRFSYGLSSGIIKDIILNKQGSVSMGLGVGYGFDFYNHQLKVAQTNTNTVFSKDNTLKSNTLFSHNIEVPLEIRWRTSTANKYKFWRIYTGVKFLYNLSNTFEFVSQEDINYTSKNISSYQKIQYGLTLTAGYDSFNIHAFYGLTPMYTNAHIGTESIETKAFKIGLIFYFL